MKILLILLVALVASGIAANIDGPDSATKELDDLNQELDDFILEDDDEEEDEFDEEDEEQSSLVRALPFLRAPTCDGQIKKSCSKNGGYCVLKPFKSNCKGGTLDKNACKSDSCRCCIPASPTTPRPRLTPPDPDVPDNRLQPVIRIRNEHIKWEQPGAFSTWNTMEQDYFLALAIGPGNEEEFIYMEDIYYSPPILLNVCDLQYGTYKRDHGRIGVFFVYHNKTQKPDQKHFGLKANGLDQTILDTINESLFTAIYTGTHIPSSFWNFHCTFGEFLKDVDCDEQASTDGKITTPAKSATTEAAPTP